MKHDDVCAGHEDDTHHPGNVGLSEICDIKDSDSCEIVCHMKNDDCYKNDAPKASKTNTLTGIAAWASNLWHPGKRFGRRSLASFEIPKSCHFSGVLGLKLVQKGAGLVADFTSTSLPTS